MRIPFPNIELSLFFPFNLGQKKWEVWFRDKNTLGKFEMIANCEPSLAETKKLVKEKLHELNIVDGEIDITDIKRIQ